MCPSDDLCAAVIPLQCADVLNDASKREAGAGSGLAVTFEEIYTRFRRPVWALARRLTQSDDEALAERPPEVLDQMVRPLRRAGRPMRQR